MLNKFSKFLIPFLILLLVICGYRLHRYKVKSNDIIKTTETHLITPLRGQAEYNLSLFKIVEENPTEINCTILANKIMEIKQDLDFVITLNKGNLNEDTLHEYTSLTGNYKDVDYIRNYYRDGRNEAEFKEINSAWDDFINYLNQDITLQGVRDINSFTMTYIDYMKRINSTWGSRSKYL